jgi:hypothetical protein
VPLSQLFEYEPVPGFRECVELTICATSSPDILSHTSTWQKAQALNFCVAFRLLSYDPFIDGRPEEIHPRYAGGMISFLSLGRFERDPLGRDSTLSDEMRLAAAVHSSANKAVAFFILKLKDIQACIQPMHFRGACQLPSASSIPFSSLMKLPLPFAEDAIENFATCHLENMAEASFFENTEWTGYFYVPTRESNMIYGIGAPSIQHSVQVPRSSANQAQRFALFKQDSIRTSANKLQLMSNHFHTGDDNHYLYISVSIVPEALRMLGAHQVVFQVNRRTGLLSVDHYTNNGTTHTKMLGALTPFGIVARRVNGYRWLWMWKREWCRP